MQCFGSSAWFLSFLKKYFSLCSRLSRVRPSSILLQWNYRTISSSWWWVVSFSYWRNERRRWLTRGYCRCFPCWLQLPSSLSREWQRGRRVEVSIDPMDTVISIFHSGSSEQSTVEIDPPTYSETVEDTESPWEHIIYSGCYLPMYMHLVTVNCKIAMRLTTAFPNFVTKYRDKFIIYIFSFCNGYKCCYLSVHGVCVNAWIVLRNFQILLLDERWIMSRIIENIQNILFSCFLRYLCFLISFYRSQISAKKWSNISW